jgi:UDP-N-acetylglucosamine--N-acetylmuramyl-(pentapeptide) pyrophosphoryl-undecaprenol N-acetylglucosamine transferase
MTMTDRDPKMSSPIVLVAGGTGGHVFPAEALAGELSGLGHALALLTDSRGAAWSKSIGGITTYAVRAGRVSGVGLARRVKGVLDLILGTLQSRRLLRRLTPSVVVGFGGYTSVPALMAASSLRLPTLIHEQNAFLGRANRLLAPRVTAIATSFPKVEKISGAMARKAVLTGNPVRPAVRALRDIPYQAPTMDGEVHLLVTGGSQGARILSDVIPSALGALDPALRARIRLAQQCRPEDIEAVTAAYAEMGLAAEVAPFFEDMAERLARAHLVICRSGASTVAELTVAGRPAILVPYAHAADDHQSFNARAVVAAGGARMMAESQFTPDALASALTELAGDPEALAAMARGAHGAGQADAATALARLATSLIGGGRAAS